MGADATVAGRRLRVLVVEDNPGDVLLIREALRDVPYGSHEVSHVPSLSGAIERVVATDDRDSVDVVVLDLSLPDAMGLEGLRRVRAASPHMPVIVLTGLDDEALALQAMQDGAQDYLVKGRIDGALVVRSLRYAVERKRAEQSARREEEAARTAQLREQFMGILGHDLRNPLNTIIGTVTLLSNASALNAQERQSVQRIARAAGWMSRMIDDLLDFTRARLGGGFHLRLEPCDLERICRQVIEDFEPGEQHRAIRLEVAAGCAPVPCDPDRVGQILSNLLSNALQYGAPDSPIVIALRSRDEDAVLSVTNQGTPIPEDIRPTLFDPFRRGFADAAREGGREGLGLGLYIVEQLALAHGGRVEVTSSARDGTTFSVVLPQQGEPSAGSAGLRPGAPVPAASENR